ncbi:MAG: hypothetical protein AB7N76_37080 [Planctomycetota bacterium]
MGAAPDDLARFDPPGSGDPVAPEEYVPLEDEYGVDADELGEGEYEVADGDDDQDDPWWDEDPLGADGFGDDPGDLEEAEGDFDLGPED